MSWEVLKLIIWNPGIQIPGIILLFYLHLNAYMALWSLYFKLFDHFSNNSYEMKRIVNARRARANVIAIRYDLFEEGV